MMRTHCPGPTAAGDAAAGEAAAGDLEHGLAGDREVGRAQGVAVHRRVVLRRHVDRRDDVFGEHAAERRAQRQLLDRREAAAPAAAGSRAPRHRQRLRVVAADAGADLLQRRRRGRRLAHGRWSCCSSSTVLALANAAGVVERAPAGCAWSAVQRSILRWPLVGEADQAFHHRRRASCRTPAAPAARRLRGWRRRRSRRLRRRRPRRGARPGRRERAACRTARPPGTASRSARARSRKPASGPG